MYLEYWGLNKSPFENVPDPVFMYYSPEHEEALTRLLYAIKGNKGIALVTGEIGSGKTMLTRVLMQQLSDTEFDIGLITNPTLEPIDFLREILYSLGLEPDIDLPKSSLLKLLNERVLDNLRNDKMTLLILDEAQLISTATFEEIRLLLNFQMNDMFMLTIVLLGQPELRGILKNIKQLNQRIAVRYHLNALNLDETIKYINTRLEKAGSSGSIINQEALGTIYSYSGGIPRVINNICDTSLMTGFALKSKVVDSEIVKQAVRDVS